MTAFPANSLLWLRLRKLGVTLKSLTANLSDLARFPFVNVIKSMNCEGTDNLVANWLNVGCIAEKNEMAGVKNISLSHSRGKWKIARGHEFQTQYTYASFSQKYYKAPDFFFWYYGTAIPFTTIQLIAFYSSWRQKQGNLYFWCSTLKSQR